MIAKIRRLLMTLPIVQMMRAHVADRRKFEEGQKDRAQRQRAIETRLNVLDALVPPRREDRRPQGSLS